MSGRVHAEAQAAPNSSFTPVRTGLLQRSSASHAGPATAPPIVHEVLHSQGQPLTPETRAVMEPRFGHDFSRVSIGIQAKLIINQPGDALEQEADRIASAVVDGGASVPQPAVARAYPLSVQRKPPSDAEKYKEGTKKVGEAFLKTDVGKDLKEQATKLGKDFLATLPGKIIAGTAAAGVIAALAATNSELPMQVPEIPLDALAPGLKMKLTYEGPMQKPTKAFISFTYEFGGSRTKKPAMTAAEKYRAETARMAAEQAKFREGLKSPEERAAEEAAFQEAFWSTKTRYGLEPLEIPGLAPKPEDELLMRKEADSPRSAGGVPPIVHEVLRSPGKPLAPETRAFMELRFGHDFSQVRVHTDPKAAESARQTNALAYTVGHDVVFASGQYIPHSSTGLRLIAHEFAHVMQQSPPAVDGATSALQVAAHTAKLHSNSLLAPGQENDFLERETDRASDAVMNGNFAPQPLMLQYGSARNVLQRESKAGPRSRRRPRSAAVLRHMAARPSFALQRKATGQRLPDVPPIVHEVLREPCHLLDSAAQAFMTSRFGHDFSHIRVHTDAKAAASARAVGAKAYTVGNDVVFASGEYSPASAEGKKLLAHELAHTLQQAHLSRAPAKPSAIEVAPANGELEQEAERMADSAISVLSSIAKPLGTNHTSDNAPTRISSTARVRLQRGGEQSSEPWIPIPVFDELDPMIIVPDVPGVPSFLRGQQVKLSTLRSALEIVRGGLPTQGHGQDICSTLLPGHEMVQSGELQGLCCPQFVRDRERCCRLQDIGLLSFRCCSSDEVVLNNRCFRPERAPTPPVSPPTVTPGLSLPTIPRLELRFPNVPFGSVQSETIDHFELNKSDVPATATATLDRLAAQLQLYGQVQVHIEGHTDSSYTPEYNQQLSEQRAQAVRDALVGRGVEANRIVVEGFGETQLLSPEERTSEERARNRRVEVWFYIPPSRGLGEGLRLQLPSITTW